MTNRPANIDAAIAGALALASHAIGWNEHALVMLAREVERLREDLKFQRDKADRVVELNEELEARCSLLTRDIAHRDELEKFSAPLSCQTHGLVPNLALFGNQCPACERDRLRGALEHVRERINKYPGALFVDIIKIEPIIEQALAEYPTAPAAVVSATAAPSLPEGAAAIAAGASSPSRNVLTLHGFGLYSAVQFLGGELDTDVSIAYFEAARDVETGEEMEAGHYIWRTEYPEEGRTLLSTDPPLGYDEPTPAAEGAP